MQPQTATSDAGAGLERYWGYLNRVIPGLGTAFVNTGTGNVVLQSADVDLAERGLDLLFERTYNSQSQHDANGDDGSEPSIYGNRWTNNFDAHIVFRYSGQTLNAISVYSDTGTRCDYTPDGSGNWIPCAGEHAVLEVDPSNSCSYWWIKKDGESYWFHTDAPGPSCNFAAANTGRVYEIFARNSNNNITFNYSFSGPQKTSNQITEIDAVHSDGQSLTMTFAKFGGINELYRLTYPTPGNPTATSIVQYSYDGSGDLGEVDKPGNDAAGQASGLSVPPGDIPQIYGQAQPVSYFCSPRGSVSMLENPGSPNDGMCLHFDYDSSQRLSDWIVNGVSNPQIPGEGRVQPTVPGGWNAQFEAYFVYGSATGSNCGNVPSSTTAVCDTDGHSSIWTIDALARPTMIQEATGDGGSGPTNLTTTLVWDSNNNPVQLQSPQDFANGTSRTISYDANGNLTKQQLPSISTSAGTLQPTFTYSYDQYNNMLSSCDAVYNASHSGNCPASAGAGHTSFAFDTTNPDPYEPYGKLTDAQTALGYHTLYQYSYGGPNEPADYGFPTKIVGDPVPQQDGTSPQPVQQYTYDTNGNVIDYSDGIGTTSLSYDSGNRPVSKTDPDGITERVCFNADGSTAAEQNALQYHKDNGVACGAHSALYAHDLDGDVITETHSYNDAPASVTRYYDGIDRVVEIHQEDGSQVRNYFDLTQSNGSPDLTIQGRSSQFRGYGNLFKVQRSFTIPGGSGATWNDVSGNAFDALDRPIERYQRSPGNGTTYPGSMGNWASTYDASGQFGFLVTSTDPVGVTTTFSVNGIGLISGKQFSDSTPSNTYTEDPDGRITQASSSALGNENYVYNAEGDLTSYAEGSGGSALKPTINYAYYQNGWRKTLSIGAGSLFSIGTPEYTYNYLQNGSKSSLLVHGKVKAFKWLYSPGGRVESQSDPWTGNVISGSTTFAPQTFSYSLSGSQATGEVTGISFPNGAQYGTMYHDAEGEVTTFSVSPPSAFQNNQNPSTYVTGVSLSYGFRGRFTSMSGTSPALNGAYQNVYSASYQYGRPAGPTIDPYTGSAVTTELPSGICNINTYQGIPTLNFDAAGRDTSTTTNSCAIGSYASNKRSYDAANHTTEDDYCAPVANGCQSGNGGSTNAYGWSASGQLRTYSSSASGSYVFHWDQSSLLFVTDSNGNLVQLNVGMLAYAKYNTTTGQEITFGVYDRDFSGMAVDVHGTAGDLGLNVMPNYSNIGQVGGYSSPQLTGYFPGAGTAPSAPQFSSVRTDGYQVGQLTFQGIRAYDPSLEQWTTPDPDKGTAKDPQTLWSYSWNNNNPLTNSDPTGLCNAGCIPGAILAVQAAILVGLVAAALAVALLPEGALAGISLVGLVTFDTLFEIAGADGLSTFGLEDTLWAMRSLKFVGVQIPKNWLILTRAVQFIAGVTVQNAVEESMDYKWKVTLYLPGGTFTTQIGVVQTTYTNGSAETVSAGGVILSPGQSITVDNTELNGLDSRFDYSSNADLAWIGPQDENYCWSCQWFPFPKSN